MTAAEKIMYSILWGKRMAAQARLRLRSTVFRGGRLFMNIIIVLRHRQVGNILGQKPLVWDGILQKHIRVFTQGISLN